MDWRGDPGGDTPDYRPGPDELILDETILPEDFDISELMRKRRPGTVLIRLNRNRPIWERHLNKEGIGSVFRLLQKRPETNRETLEAEAKIPPWVLSPIVHVLEELGLIRTTGQEIVLEKTQEKRNLADSRTYQRLIEAQRQWAFLTDESLPRIRDYLFNLNGGITP